MSSNFVEIFHSSELQVVSPALFNSKNIGDFGPGFYAFSHFEDARNSARKNEISSFVNSYQLDLEGLKVLDFGKGEFASLHFLACVLAHRGVDVFSNLETQKTLGRFIEKFGMDLSSFDLLKGYSMEGLSYRYALLFINGQIDYASLTQALAFERMKEEVVLRSKKAIDACRFKNSKRVLPFDKNERFDLLRLEESGLEETIKGVDRIHGTFIGDLLED